MTNGGSREEGSVKNCFLVIKEEQLDEMIASLVAEPWLVMDVHTSDKDERVVGWALAGKDSPLIYYVPVGHLNVRQLPEDFVLERLFHLIDDKPLVGYDLLSRLGFTKKFREGPRLVFRSDVMVEAFVCGKFPSVEFEYLVSHLSGADYREMKDLYPPACRKMKTKALVHFERVPLEIAARYACERALLIRRLHRDLFDQIMVDPKLRRIHQLEMDVLPVAMKMQETGLRVDFEKCRTEYHRLLREAEELNRSIHAWLRRNFDIRHNVDFGSSPQTAYLLVDKLGVMGEVKTAKGNRSTSKKSFEGLRVTSPLVHAIFTYRELVKAASSFYGLYPDFKGRDGRMHPRLLTCHVISGRTASQNPNVQQIPKEHRWEFVDFSDPSSDGCARCPTGNCTDCLKARRRGVRTAVREVFIPREGYLYVEADYSQIELMVLAGMACEPAMIEAFARGEDVHRKTASLIFGIPADQVTKAQRNVGKTTAFRFVYGGGPAGLAAQLGISFEQASAISSGFRKAYKQIGLFADRSAREATENGYVETLFGRRRHMDEFKAKDSKTRALGRRLAVNLRIQGTAADIGKIALVRQQETRREFDQAFNCRTYLCNYVHDSFLFEIPLVSEDTKEQTGIVREFIKAMESALCFDVAEAAGIGQFPRLKADFVIGHNLHAMTGVHEWLTERCPADAAR